MKAENFEIRGFKLRCFIIIGALMLAVRAMGQDAEIGDLQREMQQVKNEVGSIKSSLDAIKDAQTKDIKRLDLELEKTSAKLQSAANALDSLNMQLDAVATALEKQNEQLKQNFDETGLKLKMTDLAVEDTQKQTTHNYNKSIVFIIVGFVLALAIIALIYFLLRKRIDIGTTDISKIKAANKMLEEKSVDLDLKLTKLIEQQLNATEAIQAMKGAATIPDHNLVLSIANEMVRIEQNLAHMDPKTRGLSQLRNRAAAIVESLAAKGYEIPKLLGTEYHEGMNMEIVIEEVDDIEPGKQIIRRVNRPCVLYNGKMIQTADVVVAYNPE